MKKEERPQREFGGVIWAKAVFSNPKIAIHLKPSKAYTMLKDFSFWIEKEQGAPSSSILTPLLISLYEVSDSTSLPGELISEAPIIYFPQKSGKQTVSLDTLRVRIPPNGIYVSLQYIMNEEYEWKKVTKWKDSEEDSVVRDTIITRYGGRLLGVRSPDFRIVFYNGFKDEWFSSARKPGSNSFLPGTIKCEATIKFCQDK